MNITTRTTIVLNVQLDDNIRVRLLEKEGFKSTPDCRKLESVGADLVPRKRSPDGTSTDWGGEHLVGPWSNDRVLHWVTREIREYES